MTSKRLNWLDQLKGFAILLVVVGHVIQFNAPHFEQDRLFSAIYSFHMPLFFFLSGYVSAGSARVTSLSSGALAIARKATSLLIPLFVWGIIGVLVYDSSSVNFADIVLSIPNEIRHPSLWFIHNLFLMFLLIYVVDLVVHRLRKSNVINVLEVVAPFIIVAAAFRLFYVNGGAMLSFMLHLAFFIFGRNFHKNGKVENLTGKGVLLALSLLLFAPLMLAYDFSNQSHYVQKLIKVGASASGCIFLCEIFQRMSLANAVGRVLQRLGSFSLAIYVVHVTLISSVAFSLPDKINSQLALKYGVIFSIAACWILASIVVAKLVENIPILGLLLFGKRAAQRDGLVSG